MHLKIRFTAKSNEELAKGLMFSKPLANDECALFIFRYLDDHSFWNKNVNFPISLLFMDENFEIKNIGKLDANQEKPCRAEYPMTKYVLEGHADLPKEYDIKVGDFCLPENHKIKLIRGKNK
jgi:uncharacterized membrane protein (UPF0127 family)